MQALPSVLELLGTLRLGLARLLLHKLAKLVQLVFVLRDIALRSVLDSREDLLRAGAAAGERRRTRRNELVTVVIQELLNLRDFVKVWRRLLQCVVPSFLSRRLGELAKLRRLRLEQPPRLIDAILREALREDVLKLQHRGELHEFKSLRTIVNLPVHSFRHIPSSPLGPWTAPIS